MTAMSYVNNAFVAAGGTLQLGLLIASGAYYVSREIGTNAVSAVCLGTEQVESLVQTVVKKICKPQILRKHVGEPLEDAVSGTCEQVRTIAEAFGNGYVTATTLAHNAATSTLRFSLQCLFELGRRLDIESAGENPLSIWAAFQGFSQLFTPFTAASPVRMARACWALRRLQDVTGHPYPPRNSHTLELNSLENQALMDDLAYRYRQTLAAYDHRILHVGRRRRFRAENENANLQRLLGVDEQAVVMRESTSALHRPAFYVLLDHASTSVCLVIRGSFEAVDMLTDFCCQPDAEYGCHSGMLAAAQAIDSVTRSKIRALATEYPLYRVVVEGHSLGGGAATLFALLWRDEFFSPRLMCYSFGAPCVVPPAMFDAFKGRAVSVIYARDMVTRASRTTMENGHRVLGQLALGGGRKWAPRGNWSPSDRFAAATTEGSNVYCDLESGTNVYVGPLEVVVPLLVNDTTEETEVAAATTPTTSNSSAAAAAGSEESSDCIDTVTSDTVLAALRAYDKFAACDIKYDNHDNYENEVAAAAALQQLRAQKQWLDRFYDDSNVLCPAGRVLMLVPAGDLTAAKIPLPSYLTPGGCAIIELSDVDVRSLAREFLMHPTTLTDHFPHRLAAGLGLFVPTK